MKKEELIRKLLTASELEESYTPVIAGFFLKDFDWHGVEKDKVERVKRMLKAIEQQTIGHNRMIDEMLSKIREGDTDDF